MKRGMKMNSARIIVLRHWITCITFAHILLSVFLYQITLYVSRKQFSHESIERAQSRFFDSNSRRAQNHWLYRSNIKMRISCCNKSIDNNTARVLREAAPELLCVHKYTPEALPRAQYNRGENPYRIIQISPWCLLVSALSRRRKNFACTNCEKKFGWKSDLLKHQRIVHEGRKDYPCDKCEKKFGRKIQLLVHQRTMHEGRKDYSCSECEKKFGQKSHLIRHRMVVHENRKDYPCNDCKSRTKLSKLRLSRARHQQHTAICGYRTSSHRYRPYIYCKAAQLYDRGEPPFILHAHCATFLTRRRVVARVRRNNYSSCTDL
uniref:C2H2-type domain-containing protein n=1 Tax=Trichogramma kaykai TaxID=54128 RepID=A0ABD2W164_9HYME